MTIARFVKRNGRGREGEGADRQPVKRSNPRDGHGGEGSGYWLSRKMAPEYSEAEIGSTVKIAKTSKTGVIRIPDDDVVEHFDFKKLACSDEVVRNLNVRLRWCRVHARMIVLCGAPVYVK